jgi:hypothetical protein
MDQSEIDALMKASGAKAAPAKPKAPEEKHHAVPTHPPAHHHPVTPQTDSGSEKGEVISEIDAVTEVTERETNRVMDQLDQISQLVGRQQQLVTEIMKNPSTQDRVIQEAIHQVMSAGKEIQDKVFEAMDLMQFQDITRQKLERIVYHLRQIHDYIVDLLGTGLKSEGQRASINPNITRTGTTPDENKAEAEAIIAEFKRGQKKE